MPDGAQVAVLEPSDTHFYQPLWTLVGGGFKDIDTSKRPMADVMPANVDWVKAAAAEFDPDNNKITTADGCSIKYEYLVVATGMQPKWAKVKGLKEALGDGRVVSNMAFKTAPLTFKALQNLKEGRAVFTMPSGIIKCPGAGQKACYISEDYLRRQGRRDKVSVSFCTPAERIFGIPRYAATIESLVEERGIDVHLKTELAEVRGASQEAVFNLMGPDCRPTGEQTVMRYDMLHVTPPQGPIDVVAKSPLANAQGYVAIDKETMQHTQFPNVFGIGDCAAVPTSKTAAAAAAEFLVLRDNMDSLMAGGPADVAKYDGYASCPLVTKEGAVMMMEFGYGGKILETFTPFGIDQSKETFPMWLVKAELLPWAYWNMMTRGYVPWGEYKRAKERVAEALAALKPTPA
ncbi:hypothetical protein OEZ86_014601 [Tetradesmus obliquus]|nr:hypothetical protein OEZ86_014601 [Tetradesmus obliquus]